MEEDSEVAESEKCTCGHYTRTSQSEESLIGNPSSSTKGPHGPSPSATKAGMDSSFVHLPIHLYHHTDDASSIRMLNVGSSFSTSTKFLELLHLQELVRAAHSGGDGVLLCEDCILRVERALDADSERLENECLAYQQATRREEERLESLQKALGSISMSRALVVSYESSEAVPNNHQSNLLTAEKAFRDEIRALQAECQQQEAELLHLKDLKNEQLQIAQQLSDAEYDLEVERNALELEARAFNNDQEQLYQMLQEVESEVDKLQFISLPSLLLDLQVDKERGLRYPLINELRLAYRPKGDIKWNEIQVAWSLAAQLLLVVGTLFHYPSEQWKIIPLSHCAKLIFFSDKSHERGGDSQSRQRQNRAIVYHLGHPKANGCKAMRAWNMLLHQVIIHVNCKTDEEYQKGTMLTPFPKIPFPSTTPATVGTIDLTQLNEDDDPGWSRAIHFMASNLLWLSECAALYTSQQVLFTSAVLQTCRY